MEQPKFADEIGKMEYEPLLPIEKKLIVGSIVLGVSLTVILVWLSRVLLQP